MKKINLILGATTALIAFGLLSSNCIAAKTKIGAIGTTQWAGGDGVFKRPYSLGEKGNKMNITLKSAEYTVGLVAIGDHVFIPKEKEKLLVIHYTVHNPEKKEQSAFWATFHFTAVDSEDANHEYSQYVGQETNKKALNMRLKPAQKVEAYAVIKVGANGEVPKLIVKRGNGPVLRYDLRGKVKPLPAEYADPSDPTGATALQTITGTIGTYYHAGEYDFRINSIEVKTEAVGENKPAKNKAFAVANVTLKNVSPSVNTVIWSTIKLELSTDAGSSRWLQQVMDAKFFERLSNMKVASEDEVDVIYLFDIKAGSNPDILTIETRNKMVYKFFASKTSEG
jgi:hypothetical protein